tara:strand:- start:3703 stop:3882 length:180 start_codon:yes stop_codon:yes gene_type:complete
MEQQESNKGRAMNIRGIDDKLYNDFKSAVYASGFKNVKKAVTMLMKAFVYKYEDSRRDQ